MLTRNSKKTCWIAVVVLLIVSSCGYQRSHEFRVRFDEAPPTWATFSVCGHSYPAQVENSEVRGKFSMTCSGPLSISSKFGKGVVVCSVGYIDIDESYRVWDFEIKNDQCGLR